MRPMTLVYCARKDASHIARALGEHLRTPRFGLPYEGPAVAENRRDALAGLRHLVVAGAALAGRIESRLAVRDLRVAGEAVELAQPRSTQSGMLPLPV